MLVFSIFSLIFELFIVVAIIYLAWISINCFVFYNTVDTKELFQFAKLKTNHQIKIVFNYFSQKTNDKSIYSDFYHQLVKDSYDLGSENLNTLYYTNGVQWEGTDFFIWFSKKPEEEVIENWKIKLRQTVRTYDKNTDISFIWLESDPFIKMQINLVSVDSLHYDENAQKQALYSEKGEV